MEIIKKLVTRKGPGHLFQPAHFILALKTIKERGHIGRYELGRILDLGGGSIRTLINRLKDEELITVEGKKGHILTEQGERVLEDMNKFLITIENLDMVEELTSGKFNIGCQVRGLAPKIGSGIGLRDAAIAVGAKSITSLIYTKTKQLEIPTLGKDYLKNEHPNLIDYLLSTFNYLEDDVLIICGADTEILAKLGAITAILSILNS